MENTPKIGTLPIIPKKMMVILVCGGRDFGKLPRTLTGAPDPKHPDWSVRIKEYYYVRETLYEICEEFKKHNGDGNLYEGVKIISGAATGVDTAAIDWATINWVPFQEYPADWKKYGKSAGSRRNIQMLKEGKPDLVVAFPGGVGTAHMVRIAKKAGVEVKEIKYDNSI